MGRRYETIGDRDNAIDGFASGHTELLGGDSVADARGSDTGIASIHSRDEDGTLTRQEILDRSDIRGGSMRAAPFDADGNVLTFRPTV